MQLLAWTITPSTLMTTVSQVSGPAGQSEVVTHGLKQVPLEPQKPLRHCPPVSGVHGVPGVPMPIRSAHTQLTPGGID
jgi:hypothetical protein